MPNEVDALERRLTRIEQQLDGLPARLVPGGGGGGTGIRRALLGADLHSGADTATATLWPDFTTTIEIKGEQNVHGYHFAGETTYVQKISGVWYSIQTGHTILLVALDEALTDGGTAAATVEQGAFTITVFEVLGLAPDDEIPVGTLVFAAWSRETNRWEAVSAGCAAS